MINLNEVSESNIQDFALQHFDNLNPVDNAGFFEKGSLIYKLVEYQDSLDDEDDEDEIELIEFILGDNLETIIKILIGTPDILNSVIIDFENDFNHSLISTINGDNATLTEFGTALKKIFNYERYRGSDFCKESLNNLGYNNSKPCPYCNIDTIEVIIYSDTISNEEKKQALLDLDHFYPRSRFPFLALSFYNLVPSCSKCNSRMKGQKDFRIATHINPYHLAFDDFFDFGTANPVLPGMLVDDFNITFVSKIHDGIQYTSNSIVDLRIIERLETKKEKVLKFINAIDRFNSGDNTANVLFNQTRIAVFTIEDALSDFGVTNDRNDIHNTELSKLLRDIYKRIT
jgi:hypothetical protein